MAGYYEVLGVTPQATDAERIAEELVSWNRIGGELRGLLGEVTDVELETVLEDLSQSFTLATAAKEKVVMGAPKPHTASKEARSAITSVTSTLATLGGRLEASIGKTGS